MTTTLTTPRVHDVHRPVHVPGLDAAVPAIVEAVEAELGPSVELWGTSYGRPVLFEVDAGTAREMMADLDIGDHPTAILHPDQILLEALD